MQHLKHTRRIPEWLWWILSIVSVLLMGVGFSWWLWDELRQYPRESLSTTLRNLALITGGIIAMLLAVWRSRISERQSLSSQRQADTAQLGLLNERYERGAEMIGSEVLSVRMGGIYALQKLAEEHPAQYHVQIMQLLCAFVRNPAGVDNTPRTERGRRYPRLRDDVQAAMVAIAHRSNLELESTAGNFSLDLYGAHLMSLDLNKANLSGANLTNANLEGSHLTEANLLKAKLSGANMCRAYLERANMSQVNLNGAANLSWAILGSVDLSGAQIGSADFSHAQLTHTNLSGAHISATDFSHASLFRTNLSGVTLGEAVQVTSGSPDSIKLYVRLTQSQMDEAVADTGNPPKIHDYTTDIETGEPLIWRGSQPTDSAP